MSVYSGPETPESGLVLSVDLSNTDKSFKGEPTTNLVTYPEADYTGSAFSTNYLYDATSTHTFTYKTGVPNPINSPGVLEYWTGNSGYKYWSIPITIASTTTYTFSYYARCISGTGNINLQEIWRDNGASLDRTPTGDWNPTYTSNWTRYALTATATAGTLDMFIIHSGTLTGNSRIQLCGFQMEAKSYPTRWVKGARVAASNAIIDLTGTNTVAANSLTYTASSTTANDAYSFNGTSNYITMSGNSAFQQLQVPLTITAAFKTTASQSFHTIFGKYISTVNSQLFSLLRIDSGTLVYYISKSDGGIQGVSSGVTITPNNWYIASVIIDGSTSSASYQFVVNGTATTKTSFASALSTTPSATAVPTIGATDYGGGAREYFTGSISNVLIHNRALSVEECKKLYNVYRGRFGI